MARITAGRARKNSFDTVSTVGLLLPGVQASTRYDGSSVLKLGGCFMAGLATHRSAEPDTLVVRVNLEERELLLDEAPETYYVMDHYRRYPIVLVRLSRIDRDALREPAIRVMAADVGESATQRGSRYRSEPAIEERIGRDD